LFLFFLFFFLFFSLSPLFFFSPLPLPCTHALTGNCPGGLEIASSCFLLAGHLPSSDIIGLLRSSSSTCYQLTVVRHVSFANSVFLHKLAIYFGQVARLRPYPMSSARAVWLILPVLMSSVLLIICGGPTSTLGEGRAFGILPCFFTVRCSAALAVLPLTPPAWLFAFGL
jgi:hypothetical protein